MSTYSREPMNRGLLWITTAVLGVASTLMSSLGGLIGMLLFLSLSIPLVIRGDHAVALSGVLTGFGGFWLFLLARQFSSGATLDNSTFWIAVGVVPLTIGLALLVFALWRRASRPGAVPGGE